MSDSKLRILGVGAHPDDLEFGCGGVLLGEAARGSEIFLCICSRGEAGSNGTSNEREAEARSAAQILGAKIDFLEMGGDAHLEICAVNNIAIARQIRTVRPDQVFLFTYLAILTAGLIGGQYIGISPGGSDQYLKDGDELQFTQSALVLEELIGKFLVRAGQGGSNQEGEKQ